MVFEVHHAYFIDTDKAVGEYSVAIGEESLRLPAEGAYALRRFALAEDVFLHAHEVVDFAEPHITPGNIDFLAEQGEVHKVVRLQRYDSLVSEVVHYLVEACHGAFIGNIVHRHQYEVREAYNLALLAVGAVAVVGDEESVAAEKVALALRFVLLAGFGALAHLCGVISHLPRRPLLVFLNELFEVHRGESRVLDGREHGAYLLYNLGAS